MNDLYWEDEPNLEALRAAHDLLSTNPVQAIAEFETLAQKGSAASMVYLSEAYQTGTCVERNSSKSDDWLRRASEAGSVLATYRLGRRYLLAEDYAQARGFFDIGASRGYMPAIHQLGRMYWKGLGLTKDLDKAREYLSTASHAGYVFAKRDFAFFLIGNGTGPIQLFKGLCLYFAAIVGLIYEFITDPTKERLR